MGVMNDCHNCHKRMPCSECMPDLFKSSNAIELEVTDDTFTKTFYGWIVLVSVGLIIATAIWL